MKNKSDRIKHIITFTHLLITIMFFGAFFPVGLVKSV